MLSPLTGVQPPLDEEIDQEQDEERVHEPHPQYDHVGVLEGGGHDAGVGLAAVVPLG